MGCVTVLDIENSITRRSFVSKTSGKVNEWTDNLPYTPTNKLVTVGFSSSDGVRDYLIFHHKEYNNPEQVLRNHTALQAVLDKTTVLVGHNLKYDIQWLKACGFKYDGDIFDTYLFEYVLSKGTYIGLDLASCCHRRGIPVPHKDMLGAHFDKGGNTDDMPLSDLITYGQSDIDITTQLYASHKKLLKENAEVQRMIPTLKARMEFTRVLIDMELVGFKIDKQALEELETEYRARLAAIRPRLMELVQESVGHTPVNLDSPEQLSEVVFGFKVEDKKEWARYFNLGTEKEGPRKGKAKHKPPRSEEQIARKIDEFCTPLFKTNAGPCSHCDGRGYYYKTKRDGQPFKRSQKCVVCNGTGFTYTSRGVQAGLGLRALSYMWTSTGGFSIGKKSIAWITENVKDIPPACKEFLGLLQEYSAITVYLGSFIEGIQRKVDLESVLHMGYNMCITRTGRLSSTFHNAPRSGTFPIKRAIISRWIDGQMLNVDFGQLEFRVAALLAGDKVAGIDILNKVDVHKQTSDYMTEHGQTTDRQDAKSRTFKPLFGGVTGTPAEKAYYKFFLDKYSAIRDWQGLLAKQALWNKQIVSASGFHYAFPYASPMKDGSVSGFQQICNYCIQGFSFEIVMVAIIELHKELNSRGLKSLVCQTIHDSVAVDVHPDDRDIIVDIVNEVFNKIPEYINKYFPGANTDVPLAWDISIGPNMLDQKRV